MNSPTRLEFRTDAADGYDDSEYRERVGSRSPRALASSQMSSLVVGGHYRFRSPPARPQSHAFDRPSFERRTHGSRINISKLTHADLYVGSTIYAKLYEDHTAVSAKLEALK